jgi:hypothetical protein
MRSDADFTVTSTASRLQPSETLQAAAILGHCIRNAASNEFRALITYNLDSESDYANRDQVFMSVLIALLSQVLLAPTFQMQWFYENLVAVAALEEIMAVREPRAACQQSLRRALVLTVSQLLSDETAPRSELKSRIIEVERGLGMVLRLPEGVENRLRMLAFQDSIQQILAEKGSKGMKIVKTEYEWIASALYIDKEKAKRYVLSLGMEIFDKTLRDMLMNADLVMSMPEMGTIFSEQMVTLGEEASMTIEQVYERSANLAGVILTALLTTVVEESRQSSASKLVALLLKKAFIMYEHPYMKVIANALPKKEDVLEKGLRVLIVTLDAALVIELIRMINQARQDASPPAVQDDLSIEGKSAALNALNFLGLMYMMTA